MFALPGASTAIASQAAAGRTACPCPCTAGSEDEPLGPQLSRQSCCETDVPEGAPDLDVWTVAPEFSVADAPKEQVATVALPRVVVLGPPAVRKPPSTGPPIYLTACSFLL